MMVAWLGDGAEGRGVTTFKTSLFQQCWYVLVAADTSYVADLGWMPSRSANSYSSWKASSTPPAFVGQLESAFELFFGDYVPTDRGGGPPERRIVACQVEVDRQIYFLRHLSGGDAE